LNRQGFLKNEALERDIFSILSDPESTGLLPLPWAAPERFLAAWPFRMSVEGAYETVAAQRNRTILLTIFGSSW